MPPARPAAGSRRAAAIAQLAAALLVGALTAGNAGAQYRVEQFTTSSGLPQNTVSGIAQTPDGYLWFSTFDGIVRYDGVTFTIFDRGTLPVMRHTLFQNLYVDGSGTLWAGTEAGILRRRGTTFDWVTPDSASPLLSHIGDARWRADFAAPTGRRWKLDHGKVTNGRASVAAPEGFTERDLITFAYEDRRGALWLPDRSGRVARIDSSGAHWYAGSEPQGSPPWVVGEDHDGTLWLLAEHRMYRFAGDRFVPGEFTFAGSTFLRSAFIDRDGTLWVGTNERGLFRLSKRALTTLPEPGGLPSPAVYGVVETPAHEVFVASGGQLCRIDRGAVTCRVVVSDGGGKYRLVAGASGPGVRQVRSFHVARDGRLQVGINDAYLEISNGVVARSRDVAIGFIDAVDEDPAGTTWLCGGRGLARVHGDSVRVFTRADGLPSDIVTATHFDKRGTMWIGTRTGLARRDGDRFVPVADSGAPTGANIRAIHEDSTGTLWIGTFDAGLVRYRNGHFAAITTRAGLPSNGVFAIVDDSLGHFWMSGNRGVFRAPIDELNAVADGTAHIATVVAYGARDGMRSVEANGGRLPAGIRAHDGTIWFPTQDGVVAIDPLRASDDGALPRAAIERIEVDGVELPIGDALRVEPGETEIEIRYTAPTSAHAEDVRFRYRLTGVDDEWIAAGTGRRIHYSHLRPGKYTFEVSAANGSGRWNPVGAALAIDVRPRFYETTWFGFLAFAALLGSAAAAYRARVSGLKAQELRLTHLVALRTLELSQANERLLHLATEDSLTGLPNKRRFDDFISLEWMRAQRNGKPVSLIMADVDDFKLYNDTYGHPAGDECLRQVGAAIAATVRRGTDLAGRVGGEEFAIALAETPTESARLVAESLRARVAGLGLAHAKSRAANYVTVSIGIATIIPGANDSPASLVATADAALYRAKESGRNRVC